MIKVSPLWLGGTAAVVALATFIAIQRENNRKTEAPAKPVPATYAAPKAEPAPAAVAAIVPPVFEDITEAAGIHFSAVNGADGRKLMPETMGAGVGMIDYDGDGWLDLIMVNGRSWDGTNSPPLISIYRNQRDGTFRDVTEELGLAGLHGYGMGVAVADYDGDGRPDIFVTSLDGNHLLHNDGGKFTDVTAKAGLPIMGEPGQRWSTSAAWLDADGDGHLDLFVANYVRWTQETDVFTTRDGVTKSYATPAVYQGTSNRLYRNKGDGTFEDISQQAGIADDQNKALGVVVLDVNHDGHPDLFVSNDTLPNKLYINDGHGHFEDRSLEYGVAYDEMGRAKAGMGTDAADLGGGVMAVTVGNFSDEAVSHYELAASGATFTDGGPRRGLASATLADLTFGARFADLNNDGRTDLILINGHIEPTIARTQATASYAQEPRLFLGDASGRYQEYSTVAGKPLTSPMVGRAIAIGDLFNTGKLDMLISTNGGPPRLLKNATPARPYLELTLTGKGANRDALGASVTIEAGNGWRWTDGVRARSSYLSSSPYTLHTGIPDGIDAVTLRVLWPDGTETAENNLAVSHHYKLTQGGATIVTSPSKAGE